MRKNDKTIILYDENYPKDLPLAKLISNALEGNKFTETKIVADGCIVGREVSPFGEHFEKDNYNLIIVGDEPFGSGLMAPSIFTYVTDDLQREDLYFPEKTAIVTLGSMVRLNKLFDSPKFRFFAYDQEELDQLFNQLADYFGFKNVVGSCEEKQSFMVTFDLTMSFADMIKAGNYNVVNPCITSVNFPLDAEGKTGDEVFVLHFDRTITSEQAIAGMDKQGLRPATITHALAFGAQHPEEQRKYPIIFLGSSWVDSGGNRDVPCLGVYGGKRGLDLPWLGIGWDADFRFAAVRKTREPSGLLQKTDSFNVTFAQTLLVFDELVQAGNYNYVNPNITVENFPIDAEGKKEDEIFILHFQRDICTDQVILEMDKQGLCPATITHALAFGAQHPKEQRKCAIVFLGSSWEDLSGDRLFPSFSFPHGQREFYLYASDEDWDARYCFAAVRKSREHPDFLQPVGSVKVTFDTSLSFDDLIEAGKYNGVKPEITTETFPLDVKGKTEEEIFFFRIGVPITTERIIEEMDEKGFCPATSTHALLFGAQNTAEKPIVFLGTSWQTSDQQQRVIALDFDKHERRLILAWLGGYWHTYNYFAAVRKEVS